MNEPSREEVNQIAGDVVLEFGATWCPHCQAIQGTMSQLRQAYAGVRHMAIEDGKGKPLGRSFRVKLWPTLVLMRDGAVLRELVRPSEEGLKRTFAEVFASGGG